MKKFMVFMMILLLLVPVLTTAQEDDDTEAIEAEINALALELHNLDWRDPAATTWVGGNIGIDELRAEVEAGTQLDALTFTDVDGNEVDLLDNETPLIINFWASWCGPCVHEFPFALDYQENHLENAMLVFVNVSDSLSDAERFLETIDLEDVPSYRDEGDVFIKEHIGLAAYPTTILVDADGTVLIVHTGSLMPALLRFMDLVAGYPELGSFDAEEAGEPDLTANIEGVDLAEAEEIGLDEAVSNELTVENWYDIYAYTATEGEVVDIVLERLTQQIPFFDPYLVLLDENGERIAENNNDPRPPNAHIQFTFPADGTYYIVATRLLEANSIFNGSYELVLTAGEATP